MSNNGSVKSENVFDEDPHFGDEKPTERKSVEDTVTSLRKELQVLYESLKDKNEQLLILEKDVRDRDVSIKYLKNEYKKLKDSCEPTCPTCHKKNHNDQNGNGDESKARNDHQPDEILTKMQKDLKDREGLIKELNKKIMRLSDNLIFVQKESLSKDDRIDDMQREIDKFRQVVKATSLSNHKILLIVINQKVRPFTKAVVEQRNNADEFCDKAGPGVENTRVFTNEPSRLKRTAIRSQTTTLMIHKINV